MPSTVENEKSGENEKQEYTICLKNITKFFFNRLKQSTFSDPSFLPYRLESVHPVRDRYPCTYVLSGLVAFFQ